MALSAWVKWRVVAGALLLAVLFFGAGFAQAINGVMRTESGHFFNISYLIATIWKTLFRMDVDLPISATEASVALLIYCAVCLLLLLRKVRAYEVVQ
jgi:hypothetical protein